MASLGLMRASVAASSPVAHSVTMNSEVEMSIQASPMRSAAGRPARPRDRQQIVVGLGIEQRVFGQRARRDQPHHVAADHALVAARPRCCRIFGLFAHRDAMAGRDQAMQIVLGALHRHAAHRDVQALMLAALCQHDAKRPRGDLGVLEEQFIEVAHPVEQQQPGIGGLDLEVLLHHRRDACRPRRRTALVPGAGEWAAGSSWPRKLQNFGPRSYRFARGNACFPRPPAPPLVHDRPRCRHAPPNGDGKPVN